ncbi:MAG: hypothetical protein EPN31_06180 [Castellaniella sp.]|uniref:DNA polymerase III subunit beta family protein n=1 Tax=Castellaniella sp. TaxID=1955812 RepID=UPI00120209AC|nr:hypothetical protein [Castellaniella sp.]TAN29570.1 MAG: hypothetical protein EPN31_06180 [Castellaniella sp.]
MSTPITFSIPLAELQAVALAAGDKDVRYYINGVAFEFATDGLYLVATDGHRIHVIKAAVEEAFGLSGLTGQTLIVPNEVIKSIKSPARAKQTRMTVAVEPSKNDNGEATHRITFTAGNDSDSKTGFAIIGHYPDWWQRHRAGSAQLVISPRKRRP